MGKKLASKVNRDGVAERVADPAVQQSVDVDLALLTYDDQRLGARELSSVQVAKHHDATPLFLVHTVPGLGKILSLVRLYAIHDIARFPRGQAFVSSERLVKGAKESAGKRLARLAKNPATATSHGPFPRPPSCSWATVPPGKNPWPAWRKHTARGTR
jgi:transposase